MYISEPSMKRLSTVGSWLNDETINTFIRHKLCFDKKAPYWTRFIFIDSVQFGRLVAKIGEISTDDFVKHYKRDYVVATVFPRKIFYGEEKLFGIP